MIADTGQESSIERVRAATIFIPVKDLLPFPTRRIRPHILEKLRQGMRRNFNTAKALTVRKEGDQYYVIDGNHRLRVAIEMGLQNVPCCVYPPEADPYRIAVLCNEEEDVYAKQDLFDYLDVIKALRSENLTQEQIGVRINWSRDKVKDHCRLLDGVGAKILELALEHQECGAPQNGANAPFFNFTEGWFRNSGIYELKDNEKEESEEYQLAFLRWFIDEEECKAASSKIKAKAQYFKSIREQLKVIRFELSPETNGIDRENLIAAVKRGEYAETEQLRRVISNLNERVNNRALFGVDANEQLAAIPDHSIDLVVTDPPWGVNFKPSRPTGKPEFDGDLADVLEYLTITFREINRVLKANSHLYVFFPTMHYREFYDLLSKYFVVDPIPLVWVKNNHNPCDFKNRWAVQYESIFFCKMSEEKSKRLNYEISSDVLRFNRIPGEEKEHDTQKPRDLLKYLIEDSSGYKETVLDPFAGSGSTLLAAKESGRYFVGFEIEKQYEPQFKRALGGVQ
jgi:site-specific DNA-methyltransferase (adenine-specific)